MEKYIIPAVAHLRQLYPIKAADIYLTGGFVQSIDLPGLDLRDIMMSDCLFDKFRCLKYVIFVLKKALIILSN